MITVEWDNPDETIIVWENHGAITAHEYRDALLRSAALANSRDYPVGVIIDMRRAAGVPRNAFSLGRQAIYEQPPNIVMTVLVSHSTLWEKIWDMVTRMFPGPLPSVAFVPSIEEARQILTRQLQQTAC